MRTPFDHFAKSLLEHTLAAGGRLQPQYELSGEVQAVDGWFLPDTALAAVLISRGLLGRMALQPTLFEPFHRPPDVDGLRDCIHKQLAIHLRRRREARTASPRPATRPAFPRLWIISAGRPRTVIRAFGFERMPEWPTGFWEREDADGLGLIVVPELPRTRDTLILRLMGAGNVLVQAIADVDGLPVDAWERQIIMPALVDFRRYARKNASREERVFLMSTQSTYEEWLNHHRTEGRKEGLAQGRADGLRQAIRTIYEARLGPLPPALSAILDGATDISRLEAWLSRIVTCSAEDFAAALENAPGSTATS